jgi:hypothetical protein
MSFWLWFVVAQTYTWWVQPCSRELARQSMCEAADTDLAGWALGAWESASQGRIRFERVAVEEKARIRIYWAAGDNSRYGEARPIEVDGQTGAAIYVRPDLSQLGAGIAEAGRHDRLFRHTVVYLTCLHESGHVMGLPHTARFEDIMYNFGYGGDIVEYFQRYRRRLRSREDIRNMSGISAADQKRLLAIYDRR